MMMAMHGDDDSLLNVNLLLVIWAADDKKYCKKLSDKKGGARETSFRKERGSRPTVFTNHDPQILRKEGSPKILASFMEETYVLVESLALTWMKLSYKSYFFWKQSMALSLKDNAKEKIPIKIVKVADMIRSWLLKVIPLS